MIRLIEDDNNKTKEEIFVVTYVNKNGVEKKKYYRNSERTDTGANNAYKFAKRMNGTVERKWLTKSDYEFLSGDKNPMFWGEL